VDNRYTALLSLAPRPSPLAPRLCLFLSPIPTCCIAVQHLLELVLKHEQARERARAKAHTALVRAHRARVDDLRQRRRLFSKLRDAYQSRETALLKQSESAASASTTSASASSSTAPATSTSSAPGPGPGGLPPAAQLIQLRSKQLAINRRLEELTQQLKALRAEQTLDSDSEPSDEDDDEEDKKDRESEDDALAMASRLQMMAMLRAQLAA
jgi:hypothetical protein